MKSYPELLEEKVRAMHAEYGGGVEIDRVDTTEKKLYLKGGEVVTFRTDIRNVVIYGIKRVVRDQKGILDSSLKRTKGKEPARRR